MSLIFESVKDVRFFVHYSFICAELFTHGKKTFHNLIDITSKNNLAHSLLDPM